MRLGAGDVGSSEPGRLRVLPTHSLLEESYVMKDPFSPDKQHFLILGSRCSACGRLVCVSPVGGPGCGSGGRGGSERLVVGVRWLCPRSLVLGTFYTLCSHLGPEHCAAWVLSMSHLWLSGLQPILLQALLPPLCP